MTRQDVERIPKATYNNTYKKEFHIYKKWQRFFRWRNTFTATYGAWLTHEFRIGGVDKEGKNHDISFEEIDKISARPYFTYNEHQNKQIPTTSGTYVGEDNFLGVDMSAHFLGAVLQADARVEYSYDPAGLIGNNAAVTIDNFRVFTGESVTGIPSVGVLRDGVTGLPLPHSTRKEIFDDSWRSRGGSITYSLSCDINSCRSPDNKTAVLTFYGGDRYAGGTISDIKNEYVGGFITQRQ